MKPRPFAVAAAFAVLGLSLSTGFAAKEDYKRVVPLLNDTQTNIGQPLEYPASAPKIQSLIVTMQPGEQTGLHKHPYPTYGYILEGEVTLTYEGGIVKTYHAGDAFLEAVDVWHNGVNTGSVPTRILAVFMGADNVGNVIRPEAKEKSN